MWTALWTCDRCVVLLIIDLCFSIHVITFAFAHIYIYVDTHIYIYIYRARYGCDQSRVTKVPSVAPMFFIFSPLHPGTIHGESLAEAGW